MRRIIFHFDSLAKITTLKKTGLLWIVLTLLSSGNCIYAQIAEGTLYGSSKYQLITIDTTTAAGTTAKQVPLGYFLGDIEFRKDGILFISTAGLVNAILTIDLQSDELSVVGTEGLGSVTGLEFSKSGTLYGTFTDYPTDSSQLVIVDQQDGSFTYIGFTGTRTISGLAFADDGTLYGVTSDEQGHSSLLTIDTSTGAAAFVGPVNFNNVEALEFSPGGTLYACTSDSLITIDTSTGAGTGIGLTGFNEISGISFVPPPLPGHHSRINLSEIDFGIIPVGDSSFSARVKIYSYGSEELNVSNINGVSSPFNFVNNPDLPMTLATGKADSFSVNFTPQDTGLFNATLTIHSNDDDYPEQDISLTGRGFTLHDGKPGLLYALTEGYDDGRLLTINPETGTANLVGDAGKDGFDDMAINSAGEIYAIDRGDLYAIDAASGAALFIGETGLEDAEVLAFNNQDTLYTIDSDDLYTVDTQTANVTYISAYIPFTSFAFDPSDGSVWGSFYNQIYTDAYSQVLTYIGSTNLGTIDNLAFDIAGNLYGTAYGNALASIDKETLEGTFTGTTGYDLGGLAFYKAPLQGQQLRVVPQQLDFGTVDAGEQKWLSAAVSNVGTDDIILSSINNLNTPFSANDLPSLPDTLEPGSRSKFNIIFSPSDNGNFSDSVFVSAGESLSKKIYLSGSGFKILPLIVNSVNDYDDSDYFDSVCADENGDCTLRAAITEANFRTGPDTITFDIPGSGPHTIQPATPLPVITQTVVIDGTSEPDFNGTPVVELDGGNSGSWAGLDLSGSSHSGSVIKGLIINNYFEGPAINIEGTAGGHIIQGNYLGTDASGTQPIENGLGIHLANTSNVLVGGSTTDARNIISGNGWVGISLDVGATNNKIQGNFIGTDFSGTKALPNWTGVYFEPRSTNNLIGGNTEGTGNLISGNSGQGIHLDSSVTNNTISGNFIGTDVTGQNQLGNGNEGAIVICCGASDNMIGGTIASAGNTIAYNKGNAVSIIQSAGNSILSNSIFKNLNPSIDLGRNGYTQNDNGDADAGANKFQNYPDLTGVNINPSGDFLVTYSVDSDPSNSTYPITVQFFKADNSEQGKVFLGQDTYNQSNFNAGVKVADLGDVSTLGLNLGDSVITTATDAQGNTSEFSRINTMSIVSDISLDSDNIPTVYALKQNYPNPFNPATTINYDIPVAGRVNITVYNILGEKVTTLVNGHKPAGRYSVQWNASNISSGVYFYYIKAGSFSDIKKSILLK